MMNQSIITKMPENSDISGSIKIYLEKIINDDKKIWVNINNLYTELHAKEIIPVSLRLVDRKEHEQTVFDVSELVAKESKLIISGGSGCGKTITLKWLNVIYANRCLKGEVSKIPIYIALNLYNKGSFHDYARKNAKNNGLSESAFDSLLNENKIFFLIDGLDLLSSHGQFNPYSEILDFITDHNDCRCVVSSRPGFFGQFERFTVSELEGLEPEKIELFIDKYAQDDKICEPLKNKILNDEKLKSLFSNPLMLYLAIKVASRQKKDEILPSKRSQMYMEFINGMFEHDSSKMPQGYRLHSNKQQILETLMDIYFYMQCKNGVSMDYCDALEIASKHSEDKRYKPVDAESILDDIFTIGLIPKNNSILTYGIHQSFQEYFSALKLKENFEKDFDVSEAFRHPKWEEVVLFASEMFDYPDDFVISMINANELHLASKCAQNASQEIKEEICFLLADILDKSRYRIEKETVIKSLQRFGDIGIIAIVQAMHDNDPEVRRKAAQTLREIKSEKSVNALILALHDNDAKVRMMAASALREIKSEKSVDALIQALHDNDPEVRENAAQALREIKSEKSVDALIQALHDNDPEVRRRAAQALREIKSEKSIEPLIQALHDNNAKVRWNAAQMLREIKSEKSIDALIQALNDNDAKVRWNAAWALREIKSEKSIDPLIQVLNDNNAKVRWNAAWALREIKSEKSIDPLIQVLNDNDALVRGNAAWALREIKNEKSIDALIQALNDNNAKVRWNAAWALREIKSEKSIDLLIQALNNNNAKMRWNAAWALREIKNEKSIDALIQALNDNNAKVRWNAAWALREIKNEKSVDALIQALNHNIAQVRWNAAWALREIKSVKSVDALIQALKDNNAKVRWNAAWALREIKSEKSIESLIQALNDNNEKVRWNAAWALSETCTIKHKESLKKIFIYSANKDAAYKAFEILTKIEMNEKSQVELFQKEPIRRTESSWPSISTAQKPETGDIDPYFHIAVNKISKIRKPTVILDYGCGFGKLLTPMKNLGVDVLDNIHYIGVDAKTACLLKSSWTAEKYGLFKNEPEFMKPEVFSKKDITVDLALLMHTLHEIRLVDLMEAIYHITAKLQVGGQIFILEPGSYIVENNVEERNYVLWKDTDFKMIFSNHGFDVKPYPFNTKKGIKLTAVNIIKVQTENFPKEIVAEKCLLMFEAKKKELFRMLNNNPTGSEKDKEIDLLYSYISRQIDEYKAI